ncbi:MAG TPA: nucleotide pyrophosphatase/phosphodiesterase family protein [Marmoricola sp.]|nr:nucleotide pyrophosphatase/phosphodiesterase family protein [Marmoricola sp.]
MTALDGFVAPAYRDRSLADVLPAVGRALGVGDAFAGEQSPRLELPEAGSYVVFLVDGLGYELLRDHAEAAPFLAGLLDGTAPATVGVPSTTATSLTSLGTGLSPGEHGVVGFTSRIPGTDKLLNALLWSKEVDPHEWQPHPTAFARLAAAGVHTTTVNKREFRGSGLTEASARGVEFVGADRIGERLVAVQAASGRAPSLTYLYDGDLDWTGHRYGVASAQWEAQLAAIDMAAEQLRETLPTSTRLVVVADHGMVDAPPEGRLDVEEHPELREGLALLGGEARFRHLYCRAGAVDDVVATWRSVLDERAEVLPRGHAFARGWFGGQRAEVTPRIGDVVVACRDNHVVLDTAAFPYEAKLIGMHGSLTSAEMLIPVVVA